MKRDSKTRSFDCSRNQQNQKKKKTSLNQKGTSQKKLKSKTQKLKRRNKKNQEANWIQYQPKRTKKLRKTKLFWPKRDELPNKEGEKSCKTVTGMLKQT